MVVDFLKDIYRRTDNLIFPVKEVPLNMADLHYHQSHSFQFDPFANKNIQADIAKVYAACNNWQLLELHYNPAGPCLIEPDFGWGTSLKGVFYPLSNINCHIHRHPKPPRSKFFFKKKTIELEKTHSFHFGNGNYWHFFNDLIGQVHLAESLGYHDLTIVVPEVYTRQRYFHDVLSLCPVLKNRNWYFQKPGEYVISGEAHFFNTYFTHIKNFDAALSYFADDALQVTPPEEKRIFVGRKDTRKVANLHQLLPLLQKYAIEYVELEEMSLLEQVQTFKSATHMIGIHGAGLTNIMFCKGRKIKLMELFAERFINVPYYWMAEQYGFDYAAITFAASGKANNDGAADLVIDIPRLEDTLRSFL